MTVLYFAVLIVKLIAVMAYSGAAFAAYRAPDMAARKWLAHRVGAPAMTIIWCAGYTLTSITKIPFTELWLLGGAVCSLAANLALIRNVARTELPRWAWLATALPLVLVVAFMVLKPTWEAVRR